ncbi:MAG: UDP-N-acetylmuramoyl-tripeptide--D-alanyl-D-alanine ligase [Cycloclasticus sp.]
MSLQQLADIVHGQHIGADACFDAISTDTRSLKKGELFVALQGENFDANDFVAQAKSKGAIAALISRDVAVDMPYVKVNDTLSALTALAKQQRKFAGIPVVAITGSNGKTSVKEMLASILNRSHTVLATAGNLNNQIGVPLTLLKLNEHHDIAVIEMGASRQGDIAELCEIAEPTVVILNNVGAAHLEGFGDIEGVATAKGEIVSGLSRNGTAVLNKEEPWFDQWLELLDGRRLMSFGASNQADIWANLNDVTTGLVDGQFTTRFTLHYPQQCIDINLRLMGKHNVSNALAAAAAAISLDVSMGDIHDGLAALKPVHGRMQPLISIVGGVVINDCYNANPKSFDAAMSCLADINQPVCLVLGDFAELGNDSEQIHQQLGQRIFNSDVRHFYAVGNEMKFAVNEFNRLSTSTGTKARHFDSKQALLNHLLGELNTDMVVLVKGSRSQGLESIVENITIKEGGECC